MSLTSRKSRRTAVAVTLGGLGLAGLGLGSAAQLGVSDASLGAGTSIVASCQDEASPIVVSFSTGFVTDSYEVETVDLADIVAGCEGLDFDLTLTGADDVVLGTAEGTVAGPSMNVPMTSGVEAEQVTGIALVIAG